LGVNDGWTLYTTGVGNTTVAQTSFASALAAGNVVTVYATGDTDSTNPQYQPQVTWTNETPAPAPENNDDSIWKKPWIYIIIAAILLVVLGVAAYFLKRRRDASESKPLLP
jgi:heme/copper-type cytochrome/quinol oxidase subunit 2